MRGENEMYFVKVYVTYKDSVLDPQGEAVKMRSIVWDMKLLKISESVNILRSKFQQKLAQ